MMKMIKPLGLVGMAVTTMFAAQAFAAPCATSPVAAAGQMQGSPTCVAPYGLDGPGTGLQDKLNGMTKAGTPQIDVYHDQYVPDSHWTLDSSGGSFNRLIFEIAGNADINSFGIYDLADPSNRLTIFGGGKDAGDHQTLVYGDFGFGTYSLGNSTKHVTFGSGQEFGYFLRTNYPGINSGQPGAGTPDTIFYSDMGLNGDGLDHMLAYRGNGQTQLDETGSGYALFQSHEFLLAWEDLPWSQSDLDYNDMLVSVESVHPVPEPAALGMFGLGVLLIGGFVSLRRRQSLNA